MTGKFDRNVENEILSKWVLAPSKFFDPYFQAFLLSYYLLAKND